MQQCLEAQFIQLEHEQALLLEDLDRYLHILEARELKLSKYTGLEAYELSCLTGCTKVYPTDPYGVLPDGTTWLTGLEEAEAGASTNTGEKKGIFSRFFSFLWSCVTKVGNAIFGSDGTKEGAAVQAVITACENLQVKSKSLVELVSNNRDKDVKIKLPQEAKKWPDVGWIVTDLKNADIMKTVTEVLRAYPTEKILGYIGAAVEHIKQATAQNANTDFKYEQRNTSGYKELESTITALMSPSNANMLALAKFGIRPTTQSHPPACEFNLQNLEWKTATPGKEIYTIQKNIDTDVYKLVTSTNEIIKVDIVKQYRDETLQHGRTLNKLKASLKDSEKYAASMQAKESERNAIIADCKKVTTLIMDVGKTYFAFAKMLSVILNGINKFITFAEKATRKGLEDIEAAKAASNKDEEKNKGKTAVWQPLKIERGL